MPYTLMDETQLQELESQLRDYPIESEWDLLSHVAERLMQFHALRSTPEREVTKRALIGIVGYVADIAHDSSPRASAAYLSFNYDDGNQLEDVLISSGALERAGISR